jgi:carbon monoxide dehydrogenase subunit G
MGDYERSTTVDLPRDELFEFLSKVENLPRYMDRITEAHSLAGDEVSVQARVEPGDVGSDKGERTVQGEAWFRIDADARRLEWGSEGPNNYSGQLEVSEDGAGSTVTVRLRTEHDDAPGIESGIEDTLANIQRVAATQQDLNPGTGTS